MMMMLSLIILAIILIFPVGSNRLCQRLIPSKNIMKLNIISPYYAPFFKQGITESRIGSALYAAPPSKPSDAPRGPPKKKLKDDVIQVNGRVVESLPNAMFRVEIEPSKQVVLATISGKIRKNFVRIIVGDSVVLELSAYDLTRGRITFRNK